MTYSELIPKAVKILDNYQESPDIYTLTLDFKTRHEPGQFIQVSVLGIGEAPISISSYSRKFVKISVRTVGDVTNALAKLKKGDKVFVRGPYGKGYPLAEHKGKKLLLIGGGCGVAPLKGAIDYVEANRKLFAKVFLFLGYRGPDDIIFKRELNEWRSQYHLAVTVDQKSKDSCYSGEVGFVTNAIKVFEILEPENYVVFLCGPPVMMKASIKLLHEKGIGNSQIYISSERMMSCAIGQCCHCMIRGKFVCTDGPVFCYEDVCDSGEM